MADGIDEAGRLPSGATPMKNPIVTTAVATMTRAAGCECDDRELTEMVRGRTKPLAI